jgi:hypothetical protein
VYGDAEAPQLRLGGARQTRRQHRQDTVRRFDNAYLDVPIGLNLKAVCRELVRDMLR